MDELSEVKNRWLRVFELEDMYEKSEKRKQTITDYEVLRDVRLLLEKVKTLQQDLLDARNPYSSRIGQVVAEYDGETNYMIRGKFVGVSMLSKALELLAEFQKQEKIKNGMIKISKEVMERLHEFKDEDEKSENNKPS